MTSEQLIQRLRSDKRSYGTCIISPSPRWPQAVMPSKLDFVFIDTEHVTLDRSQMAWMTKTYGALGMPPIVRIPAPDPYQATMALDDGAAGVVAPYVETVEQVRALQGAIKHRPLKGRRLAERLDGASITPELDAYMKKGNTGHIFIINVESVPAIENLDNLLACPDLDGVLIGPHDLSCNLGVPEQYGHPRFLEAVGTIFQKARAAGKGAGIHYWGTTEEHVNMLKLGANMLIQSADLLLVKKYLAQEVSAIREVMGDVPANDLGKDEAPI